MTSVCAGPYPNPLKLQATVQRDSVLSKVNPSQNSQKVPVSEGTPLFGWKSVALRGLSPSSVLLASSVIRGVGSSVICLDHSF